MNIMRITGPFLAFVLVSHAIEVKQIDFPVQKGLEGVDIRLATNWGAVGADPNDGIYVMFGNNHNKDDGKTGALEDCALYRCNARTGETRPLGSLRQTAKNAGTLWTSGISRAPEEIPKGHTPIAHLNGKMYVGSQPFHEDEGRSLATLSSTFHGSHIFSVDVATGAMDDDSKTMPEQCFQRGQGIICVAVMEKRGLVIGYSHPEGDLIIYDPAQKSSKVIKTPKRGGQVARSMVVSDELGKVFTHYAGAPMSVTNVVTGERKVTSVTTNGYYWNGHAMSWDGKRAYVCSVNGDLYEVDMVNDKVRKIAVMNSGGNQFCLSISPDDSLIYAVPDNGSNGKKVVEVEINTGKVSVLSTLSGGTYTGFGCRDCLGNIYFSRHTYSTGSNLVQINISDRLKNKNWKQQIANPAGKCLGTVSVADLSRRETSADPSFRGVSRGIRVRYSAKGTVAGVYLNRMGSAFAATGKRIGR